MSSSSSMPPDGTAGSRPASQPEYLDAGIGDPVPPSRSGRRPLVVGGLAALGVLAAGGVAWAALALTDGGARPSEVLPASTLGYVAVDLEPSAAQQVEALRTLRRFPAFRDEVGWDAREDLRRRAVEGLLEDCPEVRWSADVEPWLGNAFALAAVDQGADRPVPVFVAKVTDDAAAEDGLGRLAGCGDADAEAGWVVDDGWAVIAETREQASRVLAAGAEGALADDEQFQRWTSAAGGGGVLDLYAAPRAGTALADLLAGEMGEDLGALDDDSREDVLAELQDFRGAAATVRFSGGAVEVEAAGGLPERRGLVPVEGAPLDVVPTLPGDTALAYGLAVPDGWVAELVEELRRSGLWAPDLEEAVTAFEEEAGIAVPEDLQALLGDQLAVAVGSDLDPAVLEGSADPADLPVGVKVVGDGERIEQVMARLGEASGRPELFDTDRDGATVTWSPNRDHRARLLENGSLGDSAVFSDVVPEADRASAILFVDFDAGDWLADLAEAAGDPALEENVAPLEALGVTGWVEEDAMHGLLRLTTD